MAKPSPGFPPPRPRLLALELWGLGDLALAIPFLRAASAAAEVTLLAKPNAGPLLQRFAPKVTHVPLRVPWAAFTGKYRLHRWPWPTLSRTLRELRGKHFDLGVSPRHDPRDHVLLALAGARRRLGFPRRGSRFLLTDRLQSPAERHRSAHWSTIAAHLGWELGAPPLRPIKARRVAIHTGAGHPVRIWPRERFTAIADRLKQAGWQVVWLESSEENLDGLVTALAGVDRFIGNDSGPGHLAALLGVPTFTIFGPQLPELFAPQHPQAAWIEGQPCPYKPCFDRCRFPEPFCLLDLAVDAVWPRIKSWLESADIRRGSPSPDGVSHQG